MGAVMSVPVVRARTVLPLLAIAASVVAAAAPPAAADCIRPMGEFAPANAPRGREATEVGSGSGSGDDGDDPGPAPAGEGSRGVPPRDVDGLLVHGDEVIRVFASPSELRTIDDDPPAEGAAEEVVTFGPDPGGTSTTDGPAGEAGDGGPPWELIGLALIAGSLAVAVIYPRRRLRGPGG